MGRELLASTTPFLVGDVSYYGVGCCVADGSEGNDGTHSPSVSSSSYPGGSKIDLPMMQTPPTTNVMQRIPPTTISNVSMSMCFVGDWIPPFEVSPTYLCGLVAFSIIFTICPWAKLKSSFTDNASMHSFAQSSTPV